MTQGRPGVRPLAATDDFRKLTHNYARIAERRAVRTHQGDRQPGTDSGIGTGRYPHGLDRSQVDSFHTDFRLVSALEAEREHRGDHRDSSDVQAVVHLRAATILAVANAQREGPHFFTPVA